MEDIGIGSWIHRRRRKSAGRVALVSNNTAVHYEELAERIDRFASALAHRGIAKGDRVAYLGDNHPAFLETLFATTTLGAIFVPLNTRLAPPEVRYALQDSGSRVLVHSDTLQGVAVSGSTGTEVGHRIIVRENNSGTTTPARPATSGSVVIEDLTRCCRPAHRSIGTYR